MTPLTIRILVIAVAGAMYVAASIFPDAHDALVALAGMATGLLFPQVGKPGATK